MRLLPDLNDDEILSIIREGYHTAPEIAQVLHPTDSYTEYSFALAKIRVRLQRMEKNDRVRKVGFQTNEYGTKSRVWEAI